MDYYIIQDFFFIKLHIFFTLKTLFSFDGENGEIQKLGTGTSTANSSWWTCCQARDIERSVRLINKLSENDEL